MDSAQDAERPRCVRNARTTLREAHASGHSAVLPTQEVGLGDSEGALQVLDGRVDEGFPRKSGLNDLRPQGRAGAHRPSRAPALRLSSPHRSRGRAARVGRRRRQRATLLSVFSGAMSPSLLSGWYGIRVARGAVTAS